MSRTLISSPRSLLASLVLMVGWMFLLQACGGGGGGSTGGGSAPPPTPGLSLFAGNLDGPGNIDGTGDMARFNYPQGVAVDSTGNIFVADRGNYTIRRITPAGVVTTFAGSSGIQGTTDGTGSAARFSGSYGLAIDSFGNMYVADYYSHTIRKITSAGVVTTFAGAANLSGSANGTGSLARFYNPAGVATDSTGNIYVADRSNYIIRKITPAGVVTTLAGLVGAYGNVDATGSAARFSDVAGIATDSLGNVFVADSGNSVIRKVTPAGVVTTIAAQTAPYGIATDTANNVYVGTSFDRTIVRITPAGVVSMIAGTAGTSGTADGTGAAASFRNPISLTTDSADNIYLSDADAPNFFGSFSSHTIRKITPAGVVTTLAGKAASYGQTDSAGGAARFYYPGSLAADGSGNVYVADTANNRAVRKISPAGQVSTLFALGPVGINTPIIGVAADSVGNIFAADGNNYIIRKFTVATGALTTLAGTSGNSGSADGIGPAASFNLPSGLATDSLGNTYVADRSNHIIRKITPGGEVTPLAGSPGLSGSMDGTGSLARFNSPENVAIDNSGNVYVSERFSHTIRKITPAGVVTTLAGSAGASGSGDGTGSMARFNGPRGITTDNVGNIFVADTNNQTIRKITPAGVVTTVVGLPGQAGFVPGTLPGVIASPVGVVFNGGLLYISMSQGVAVVAGIP